MNKRVVAVLAIAVMFPLLLAADSFWEGSAAMGLYGRFPSTGFFGASNSFSANTMVQVENLENGRKVNVIITGRTGGGSLFLILSQNAAEALGISSDEVIRARVVLATDEEATAGIWPDDQPLHPDPDVNPAERAEVLPSIGETAEAAVQSDRDPSLEPDPTIETDQESEIPVIEVVVTEETSTTVETDPLPDTATPVEEEAETTEAPNTSTETLEPDTARVADLDRVDPVSEEQPERTGVVEPQPTPKDEPIVSAIKPVPEFDMSDDTAQLTVQDAPEVPAVRADAALASEDTPDTDSAYVSALQASPAADEPEETPLAVIPPEPVYVAEEPVIEAPEAEDILAVSDLLPPPETEDASRLVLSRSIDEPSPTVTSADAVATKGDGPWLTDLMTAEVPEGKVVTDTLLVTDATDYPFPEVQTEMKADAEITEDTGPDVLEVSNLKDYRIAAEAPLSVSLLPEPVFRDDVSVPIAEDILRISDLKEQPDVAEPTDITVVAELPDVPEEPIEEPKVVIAEQEPVLAPVTEALPEVTTIEQTETPDESTTEVVQVEPKAIVEPVVVESEVTLATSQPVQDGSGIAALRSAERPVAVGVFADYTVTTELRTDAYYLQLGAFREPNTASSVAVGLSDTYPVTVYASGMNESLQYKVMLGPLKRDESGTLLREFRAKGYSDAFVRKGS